MLRFFHKDIGIPLLLGWRLFAGVSGGEGLPFSVALMLRFFSWPFDAAGISLRIGPHQVPPWSLRPQYWESESGELRIWAWAGIQIARRKDIFRDPDLEGWDG